VPGFKDELGKETLGQHASIEPDDDATFSMRLATPPVRLRIADTSGTYALLERTYTATDGRLDVEVKLAPTQWILLHGQVLFRDGARLRPIQEGDGKVNKTLLFVGRASVDSAEDDSYFRKVPRALLPIRTVSKNRAIHPSSIDLRGATEAQRQIDLILEPRPR